MDRISAFTDLVTPLGSFRYGTQAGGVAPTPLKAEWLNLVQEELCNFITAYLPKLDAADNTQLLKAARSLTASFAIKADSLAGYGILDAYTQRQTDSLLAEKAAKGTSLAGYGILDAYTRNETDYLLSQKANWAITLAGYGIGDAYTKQEVLALLQGAHPVGSLYFNASNGTNPATLLGFGTWVPFGQGRMLLGVGAGQDARGETRGFNAGDASGEYAHVLTASEMPSHTHGMPQGVVTPVAGGPYTYSSGDDTTTQAMAGFPPTNQAGGDAAHNNLPPYLAVFIWCRTA